MKNYFACLLFVLCVIKFPSYGQGELSPPGASMFIRTLGGLSEENGRPDILQQIAGDKIDAVEGGGGVEDWTSLKGRVFLTRRWMVEIGKMSDGYSYDFQKALATEMQKRLRSEGFKLNPAEFKLHSLRYQKGTTIGTLEVRSFFLNNGNLPLRIEFIFNESYLISSKKNKKAVSNR